ncbi:MAG: hypothetical protein ABI054_02095, partial [Planctomycetota bacterium]
AGVNPSALELEPTRESRPEGSAVGAIDIDPQTEIQGPIRRRGKAMKLAELLSEYPRLPVPPAPDPGTQPDPPKKNP